MIGSFLLMIDDVRLLIARWPAIPRRIIQIINLRSAIINSASSPLAVPDAQEPDYEEKEDEEKTAEDEAGLALLGFEGAATGVRGGRAAELLEAGIGEGGGVEAMMRAGAAIGQQLVTPGTDALGFDAGSFLKNTIQLLDALPDFFLLLEESLLALIQWSAGFAGSTA